MLLLSVLRPSLEYGSEVWEGNKSQAASLESIMLGAKRVLGCSSKLQTKPFGEIWAWSFCKVGVINVSLVGGTRSLACPFLDIQSNSFKKSGILNHVQIGNVRYGRVVDDIFESLELDKGEWVESISKGETSIKEFLALVDESINALGSIAHICAHLFRTFRVHSAYMRAFEIIDANGHGCLR